MAFFTPSPNDLRLYIGEQNPDDGCHLYLVLPKAGQEEGYDLRAALFDAALAGTLVFSPLPAPVDGKQAAEAFVEAVEKVIEGGRSYLWLRDPDPQVFEADPDEETAILGVSADGKAVTFGLAGATIVPDVLSLQVPSGMEIDLPKGSTTATLTGVQGTEIRFVFGGSGQLNDAPSLTGELAFSGPLRGVFRWPTFIPRQSLREQLFWGFQFLIPVEQELRTAIHEYLPFASGTEPADQSSPIGFRATVDPVDPYNLRSEDPARTALTFTGEYQDGQAVVLFSWYRTVYGDRVELRPVAGGGAGEPARLVFSLGEQTETGAFSYLTGPEGDFLLRAPTAAADLTDLLCGLEGSEYISFHARPTTGGEDRLRFRSRQSAYAPVFPFPRASPTGPPTNPDAPLLTHEYLNSWATLLQADGSGAHYVAQPRGANLFGQDATRSAGDEALALLWPSDVGYRLPADEDQNTFFPLGPYADATPGSGEATFTREQIESFERQVVSPTRRSQIGAPATSLSRRATLAGETGDGTVPLTTPSGIIARVTTAGGETAWDSIVLGQNDLPSGGRLELAFDQPSPELQQAFQTNSLFLVAANACYLGQLSTAKDPSCPRAGDKPCPGFEPSGGVFRNEINVEEWRLAADIGVENRYSDYRNVLIVKGRTGVLWDPSEEAAGLVQNPEQWTQRGQFASPSFLSPQEGGGAEILTAADVRYEFQCPDPNQQVILSQWLDDYFLAASRQTSDYFRGFNQIARDPNWTGVLVLRADITRLPSDLVGILAGVRDRDSFNAHHLGINVTKVDGKTVSTDQPSSIFGLIYYQDPDYDPERPETPVQPTAGETYDFITLTLNVLFENSAVKDFKSFTQLTLNALFDQQVTAMEGAGANRYNSVILRGSFQRNGDQTVYSMAAESDARFGFDANALERVEVDRVQMSTRNQDAGEGEVVIWFALTGFLDFGVITYQDLDCPPPGAEGLEEPPPESFDILSFGTPEGAEPGARQGLAYSNLGLRMSFRVPEEGQTEPPKKSFEFVIGETFFNVDSSTPRSESLFLDFVLQLEGIVRGAAEATPSSQGYLPVTTAAPMTGVDGSPWYGLRYKLDLGSPGKLAGKAGLDSYLLIAWSSESRGPSYKTAVAIQLPGTSGGAKLISLQTVLSLSIGQIWLNRASLPPAEGTPGTAAERAWLLLFNEIALKFLGLVKIPPGGTSTFYLYGNPVSGGKPSGLGWYAIYKADAGGGQQAAPPAALTTEGG